MNGAQQLIIGNIYTYDTDSPYAEAMAVRNGRIVYIGSERMARQLCDAGAEVLDYGKNTVYPGFIDAHTHGLMAAQRLAVDADLTMGKSVDDYLKIFTDFVHVNPGRSFYSGAGWQNYGKVSAAMLDAICPDVPAVLTSIDGHSVWVNSKALEAGHVDAAAIEKFGTDMIHVDESGKPTGLISEMATMAVRALTVPTKAMVKEGLLAWQKKAFATGLTAVGEAMMDYFPFEVGADAYKELVEEGRWKLRTFAYPMLRGKMADEIAPLLDELAKQYNSAYFRVQGFKLFVDGVVEAHTASLTEPYCDQPGYYGVNYFADDPQRLNTLVQKVNAGGYPVHFHTIGDRAVKMALDVVGYSVVTNGDASKKNCLAHLQLVREADIERFAEYGAVAVVAPLWVPVTEPAFSDELRYVGEKRAWASYPIGALEKAGATICFHTDYPVSAFMDPVRQLYQAVNRMHPLRGESSARNPGDGIGIRRTLLASNVNAAYLFDSMADMGTFAVGKLANCTVFDSDLLRIKPEEIAGARLVATVVDGKEVYRS